MSQKTLMLLKPFLASDLSKNNTQSIYSSCLWAMLILCFALLLIGKPFLIKSNYIFPSKLDSHGHYSLILALNKVICGKESNLDNKGKIENLGTPSATVMLYIPAMWSYLSKNPNTEALLSYPTHNFGSNHKYCATVTKPFVNNENTLRWIMQSIMYLAPYITLVDLGFILLGLKLLLLSLFVFFMLYMGASVLFAFLATITALQLLLSTQLLSGAPGFAFSLYPFLLPTTLAFITALALCLKFQVHKKIPIAIFTMIGIGFFTFLFINLRTSYFFVVSASILLYLIFVATDLKKTQLLNRYKILLVPLLLLSVIIATVKLSSHEMLAPIEKVESTFNASYHLIAHPLVLSLDVPSNTFAESQGIKWNDDDGLRLSKKIDPHVTYYGPGYEKALFTFYAKLWIYHPHEMIKIYINKMRTVSSSQRINGFNVLILFLLALFFSFKFRNSLKSSASFALLAMGTVGLLLYFESAIIVSTYYVLYHAYLRFWTIFIELMLIQICIDFSFNYVTKLITSRKILNPE